MNSYRRLLLSALLGIAAPVLGVTQALASGSPFSVPPGFFEQHGPVTNSYGVAGAPPNPFSTFLDGVRCHYEYRTSGYGERTQVKVCD